ncbi:MAG TPA: NAD(P)H-dependent oxidoreductase [Bacteroidales bacterium]|jgi:NAD(P)H-dependent FMN reductase|nr:NAD(P)H-dependent oxidoreductase [Bacteroidales bacterium]
MSKIVIISPSVRAGRKSHRVAVYIENLIREKNLADVEILDLHRFNFPLFDERLKYQQSPLKEAMAFAEKIRQAEGVVVISPEYNGGSPASLKNAIDLLVEEWYKKPVAFATVSDGNFAGTQAIISLQFSLSKLGAMIVPATLRFPSIQPAFDENGIPAEKEKTDRRTIAFLNELLWYMEARKRMS